MTVIALRQPHAAQAPRPSLAEMESEIGALHEQIATLPARSLSDVAVKLRRLLEVEGGPEADVLLATALDGLEGQP